MHLPESISMLDFDIKSERYKWKITCRKVCKYEIGEEKRAPFSGKPQPCMLGPITCEYL